MSFSLRITSKARASKVLAKLAILIPTYRFDARARQTITGMASLASEQISVIIADNSENPEKWKFLARVAHLHPNIQFHCHKENIGAARNWAFLFDQTDLPYYLVVADDDVCTAPFVEAALRQLETNEDAAAAAGSFILTKSTNEFTAANRGRTESNPSERCINFTIGGGNSLPNSMGRLSAFKPYISYLRSHPLKATFFDWMMAYTLLGRGKYYTANAGCYLYDVSNWESAEACWRNDARCYVEAGLPEAFTWFHNVYWAVELAHFFRGRYSPISDPLQSRACAQSLYRNRMLYFRHSWANRSHSAALERLVAHHPRAVDSLRLLIANDDAEHPQLFHWFGEVLAAFDSACAAAYVDYVTSSVATACAALSPIESPVESFSGSR